MICVTLDSNHDIGSSTFATDEVHIFFIYNIQLKPLLFEGWAEKISGSYNASPKGSSIFFEGMGV